MGLMVLVSELLVMMINVYVQTAGGGCWCVCVMKMNGVRPPLTLPMSTVHKHREMIWDDILSCSLMQLYIPSTY